MRGRVPRPREERIRAGSTRNLPAPVLIGGRPEVVEELQPPTELGHDAQAWWDEVVPALTEARLIDRLDVYVLACAAGAWGDVVRAERVIGSEGPFAIGSTGQIVPHAATKLKRDAMMLFERYLNHLALSPVARTRLGLAHLHGRAMTRELERDLDGPAAVDEPEPIDVTVLEDSEVGLPGV